jgi:TetR/AcrR family transcriptional regulator
MSTNKRRELEKYNRRNDILNAAENLFFSQGFENVSLNEIAKKVHLGRSTIYLYFENKEELFFAIVLRGALILHKLVQEEVNKVDRSIEKLEAFRSAYYTFANRYPDHLKSYNYLFSGRFEIDANVQNEHKISSIAGSKYYEEYKKILDGNLEYFPIPKYTSAEYLNEIIMLRGEMLNILCEAIEQGKHEGIIRPELNSAEATVILTLIANSIDNLPPDLKNLLETQKIDHKQFLMDVGDFIGYMVSNRIKK